MNNKYQIINSSFEKAIETLAYNINKMCFINKIENFEKFGANNQIRLLSSVLANGYSKGKFYTKKAIEEKKLELNGKQYGTLLESKKYDEELGTYDTNYYYVYNIAQFVDCEEEVEKTEKKYNLKKEHILEEMSKEKLQDVERIISVGILRAITGKDIDYKLRFVKESKEVLIKLAKMDKKGFIKNYTNSMEFVKKYLTENEIVESETVENEM